MAAKILECSPFVWQRLPVEWDLVDNSSVWSEEQRASPAVPFYYPRYVLCPIFSRPSILAAIPHHTLERITLICPLSAESSGPILPTV